MHGATLDDNAALFTFVLVKLGWKGMYLGCEGKGEERVRE
jgi:hypothetical protein